MSKVIRKPRPPIRNAQRDTILALVMAFVIVLLLVQLWLLVEAVEGYMGGAGATVLPATLASGLCCLGAWRLWSLLRRRF